MFGNVEFGKCDIKCECHRPEHFEIVYHRVDCVPTEPKTTKIEISTELLKQLVYKIDK